MLSGAAGTAGILPALLLLVRVRSDQGHELSGSARRQERGTEGAHGECCHRLDEVLHLALDGQARQPEVLDALVGSEVPVLDRELVCRADDAHNKIISGGQHRDLIGADAWAELHRIYPAAIPHDVVSIAAAEEVRVVALTPVEDVVAACASQRVITATPQELVRRRIALDRVVLK
jgi:hypothetical protein